jgi:hypothetical protein
MDDLINTFQHFSCNDTFYEYQILCENIKENLILNQFNFQSTKERYLRYLKNIINWEERSDIEEAIYRFINSDDMVLCTKLKIYIDTELYKYISS